MISEPLVVEKGLRVEGGCFCTSLSHQGILAIYSWSEKNIIQFTNLINEKQMEIEVESGSSVAFYDDKVILLTYGRPLREAKVEDVFDEPDISVFQRIGNEDRVSPYTDTSLLHSRRILCYASILYIPPQYILLQYVSYEYNVDTKENKRIDIDQEIETFSSLMGIDCGVKAVFQDYGNNFTYALGWDNKVTLLRKVKKDNNIRSLFASSTSSKVLSKAVLRYDDYLIKGRNRIVPQEPIRFQYTQSVIRVYEDIFLLYDDNTKKWVLCRIIVP